MTVLLRLDAPSGGQIGYHVFGTQGDWIALIHGWCGSAEHWDIIGPILAKDYRVLVVSHPGFGGMAPPPPAGQTIRAMGTAVAHVLDHLDISNITLIGHSMGGPIATETAIAAPGRVNAVLGLDTLSDRDYYGRVADEEIARRHRDFLVDYPACMRIMVDNIVHPTTGEDMRAAISDAMIAAAVPAFALDIKDDLFAWNAEERWPLIQCRGMLLNSRYVARLAHPEPMACFAATPIETYESGHFPMIEAPEMIVSKIISCINSLAPRVGIV
ncbi:alpha/beta fold hydrolase [Pararhizobium polonicum]|uniref:alpha/beta fold hydrolase n=1 Tax=Pararhizobium polonicum TaxID=1612624 RepID=UPI00083ABC4A|nr:alpha/beta hydrolase [Pararhizobium polonicum]